MDHVELTCAYRTRGPWPSGYIVTRTRSAVRHPGCCITTHSQHVGQKGLTTTVLPNLLSPYRVPGEGNGTPLQYSCLENAMDGGAWWATVHGVAKSRTRLSDFTFTFHALEKEMATHSRLENPRVGGAWWAAVYGVAQSRTRLKRLSSSSSYRVPGREPAPRSRAACCLNGALGAACLTGPLSASWTTQPPSSTEMPQVKVCRVRSHYTAHPPSSGVREGSGPPAAALVYRCAPSSLSPHSEPGAAVGLRSSTSLLLNQPSRLETPSITFKQPEKLH